MSVFVLQVMNAKDNASPQLLAIFHDAEAASKWMKLRCDILYTFDHGSQDYPEKDHGKCRMITSWTVKSKNGQGPEIQIFLEEWVVTQENSVFSNCKRMVRNHDTLDCFF